MPARTEADVLRRQRGQFSLDELYAAVEAEGRELTARDGGDTVVHGATDTRSRRRVRGALQTMRRNGRARRVGDSLWVLDGEPQRPTRAVLISLDGTHRQVELRLAAATRLLDDLDEPADLILTDPPYGLGVGAGRSRDTGERVYARNHAHVVEGYVDVEPRAYREFTSEWVSQAATAIRPGGYLAVVTGPQQAAYCQIAAEDAGLEYVNSLAVGKVFALRTTRRFAHAHWTVTLMTRGPLHSPARVFNPPADLPAARSGRPYPLDHWEIGSVGRAQARPGQTRYPNTLPEPLVDRLLEALTRPVVDGTEPDLVCDPFLGGGTTALAAMRRGLRFIGGDLNPGALTFTIDRLSGALA